MPSSARRPLLRLLLALCAGIGVAATAAHAAPVEQVSTLDDAGPGSLRQAIADVDAGGTVAFSPLVSGTITLTSGEIAIDKGVTIDGPGPQRLAVSGNDSSRIFLIDSAGDVELSGMTLTDGSAGAPSGTGDLGGAVRKGGDGSLTIRDSRILDSAVRPGMMGGSQGGGLAVTFGDLHLERVTIAGNEATGLFANAGGLLISSNAGSATLRDVTIAGNTAGQNGGGVYVMNENTDGPVVFERVTLAGNTAGVEGGGLYVFRVEPQLVDSIVAGNSASGGPDCFTIREPLVVRGANLVENTSGCTTSGTGTLISGEDPLLGPLALDGPGDTETMALGAGSPALDAAPTSGDGACAAPATDQRGVARPQGTACDLGAFEARPAAASLTPSSHDFGARRAGSGASAPAQLTLSNGAAADLPLPLDAVALAGADADQFALDMRGCPATVAPGASCALEAAFAPTRAGGSRAAVEAGAARATLRGSAYVLGIATDPASLAFGDQQVATTSAPRTVTVTGSGGPLTIGGAAVSGPFSLVADGCAGRTLALGERCELTVAFAPTAASAATGTLTIPSDAGPPLEIPLTGTGTAPPRPPAPPAPPEPPAPPAPRPPPVVRPAAIARFTLAHRCVRPTRAGRVQVGLNVRLTATARVRVQLARAIGTRGMPRCPRRGGSGTFDGTLSPAGTFTRGGGAAAAATATIARRYTLTARLPPALYRVTVQPYTSVRRLGRSVHRWLRVLTP